MITLRTSDDPYGKLVHEGRAGLFTERRLRAIRRNNKNFYRRPKNGLYDPMTYYHVVDILCQLPYHDDFDATSLTEILNMHKKQFEWDSRTVGRILSDLHESLQFASPPGQEPIRKVNHSRHIWYTIQRFPHTAVMLVDTLMDLAVLVESKEHRYSYDWMKKAAASPLESVAWLNPGLDVK